MERAGDVAHEVRSRRVGVGLHEVAQRASLVSGGRERVELGVERVSEELDGGELRA